MVEHTTCCCELVLQIKCCLIQDFDNNQTQKLMHEQISKCLKPRRSLLQIQCCSLMLDFDSDDMVCDLFKVMLDTVK